MNQNLSYQKGVVKPVECLKSGFHLIKDQYWLFFIITFVGIIIGSLVPLGVLMGPMIVGMFLCFFKKIDNQPFSFEHVFRGFDYFLESFIALLIQMAVFLVFVIPIIFIIVFFILGYSSFFSAVGFSQADSFQTPSTLIFSIIVISLLVIFICVLVLIPNLLVSFSFPLIADKKISGYEAVKYSIQSTWANFGGLFLLFLMCAFLAVIGILCCYIGVFFVFPVIYASQAVAYRQVFAGVLR